MGCAEVAESGFNRGDSVGASSRSTACRLPPGIRGLMLEVQHLALDQDRYVNEMIEEAARDLLKKYREMSPKKGPG
ncbi:MAG: hypothetical protein K2Q17_11820 [Nitrospiraceae bacterium]|jgi:hypothetical protein|uniref:hypothetical protein n=1 Tax=Nitrospira cf. moscoviensis SBR1015 TaxID=96242 RepID=UPI000A0B8EDB|nr:hypothetical protein [Nitrospira cf. moscoviensis SBR1015]MBY0248344.1 hypothetical protein [Nitrospiraceae bacterium]OQW37846.1 MAG: hypothetical protein A4E20_17420 [Nitrospira sp. SG-bin2]